jgi:hypothetical protein
MSTQSPNTINPSTSNNAAAKRTLRAYRKQTVNASAVVRALSWLQAVGIEATRDTVPGCDLAVVKADGTLLPVKVAVSFDEAAPEQDHAFVITSELTSRSLAVAFSAFHVITEAAGHGRPTPIDRGQAPTEKISYENDFELVALRHQELRRVANPSTEDLKAALPVIEKAISRFAFINRTICIRHGIEREDLRSYCLAWTSNYLGLYAVLDELNADNQRKLYAHLTQRLLNFLELLLKKDRSCLVDRETAALGLFGRHAPAQGRARHFADYADGFDLESAEEVEEEDAGFLETEEEVQERAEVDADIRRKAAKKTLAASLSSLSPERLVEVLTEAANNQHLCHEARVEARKQLRLYQARLERAAAKAEVR